MREIFVESRLKGRLVVLFNTTSISAGSAPLSLLLRKLFIFFLPRCFACEKMGKCFRKLLPSNLHWHCFVSLRRISSLSTAKELKKELERLRKEAEEKGFAKRDAPHDMDLLLESTKNTLEKLPGSNAHVAHLPPKQKEITPFDAYKRSTTQFTSLVTPYGVSGTGLGAGFGVLPDKRLGFLRPRQSLQPRGSVEAIEPKFDENGMPIDVTLSKAELLKRRKEYLKSFQGTTMSSREHFLLVDLDFDKDAVLFGNNREEFEHNVRIMKKVIIGYQRWERSDNFYYYSSIVLKILTIWVLIECVYQYYELQLLATQYSFFAEGIEKEVSALRMHRTEDLQRVFEELRCHPPNFKSTMKAIREEKRRFLQCNEVDENSAANTLFSHVGDKPKELAVKDTGISCSAPPAFTKEKEGKSDLCSVPSFNPTSSASSMISHSLSAGSVPAVPLGAGKPIPLDELYQKHSQRHPMDTTGEGVAQQRKKTAICEQEMKQLQEKVLTIEKERERMSIFYYFQNTVSVQWHALLSLWKLGPSSLLRHPLSSEDISRYSYAASPTSVDCVRRVRRILLPRSEDFTQIVRQEMVAHANSKRQL